MDFRTLNAVIFGNRLNQVTALLGAASEETQMALLRIYWAGDKAGERRQTEGQEYSGAEMLLNLHRYYVESLPNKGELFEASKHPVYRLLCNHLLLFFAPTFVRFHQTVALLAKQAQEDPLSRAKGMQR